PGRAPPVPADLPRPLPGSVPDRRDDVPGVRGAVHRPQLVPRRPRLALPLAAGTGPADPGGRDRPCSRMNLPAPGPGGCRARTSRRGIMSHSEEPGPTTTTTPGGLDPALDGREFAEAVVETVREPLVVLDAELRVRAANR